MLVNPGKIDSLQHPPNRARKPPRAHRGLPVDHDPAIARGTEDIARIVQIEMDNPQLMHALDVLLEFLEKGYVGNGKLRGPRTGRIDFTFHPVGL